MKQLLLLAGVFVAIGTVAHAQQTEPVQSPQRFEVPLQPSTNLPAIPPMHGLKGGATTQEVQDYRWSSHIISRPETGGDSSRFDAGFPALFSGGTEWRGAGQIFAPNVLYSYYNGQPYTEESDLRVKRTDDPFASDLEYIEQFKGAAEYTVDAIVLQFYKNPNFSAASAPIEIDIYKIPKNYNQTSDFTGSTYKRFGFHVLAEDLQDRGLLVKQIEVDDIGLDSTISNDRVHPTVLDFGETPLQVGKDTAVLVMVVSPIADVNTYPIPPNADYTLLIGYDEYFQGILQRDPNDPNASIDTRKNHLDSFKTFGVVQFKRNDSNFINTAWSDLLSSYRNSQGQQISTPVHLNSDITFFGRVDIASGVSYHFGKDVKSQGLGSVAPNPVTTDARLPFSLTEKAHVTMELFNSNGEQVKKLVDYTYIPGNYSVVIPIADLRNGAYVVRMTADEKVYTTKLTVAR